MTTFLVVTTLVFFMLSMIWTRTGVTNFFMKMGFIIMTVWSAWLLFVQLGYLIKIS